MPRPGSIRRLAAALILCGPLAATPASAAGSDAGSQIQGLLDRRASALLEGDRDAFLGTVDPADPGFVRRQRLLFEGFRLVGLRSYRLSLARGPWPELTTPTEVQRYGDASAPAVHHVEERYRIAGFDSQPALEDLFLTFVRRDGDWAIASDSDLDDVGLFSGRKLWESDRVTARRSEHFLYLSHAGQAGRAQEVLDAAERAIRDVVDDWRLPWDRRVLILAPGDETELARVIQAPFDIEGFVAFAFSGVDRTRDWDLVGHRIILNPARFAATSPVVAESILAHELTHIATREYAGPSTPAFVDEGLAEWASGSLSTPTLDARIRSGRFDGRLPRDFEFVAGEGVEIRNAYEESHSAFAFAEREFGQRAINDMYRLLGEARLAPGTGRYHVARAMRAAFGVGLADFERTWAEWARNRVT